MVLALALSLLVTAMVGRSVMELRIAKADLERRRYEYILDGAQLQAAATAIRAGAGGPFRWALPTDAGFVEALVEDEAAKLRLADSSALTDDELAALGVADIPALRARLASAPQDSFVEVSELDPAPLWRECAPSLLSSLGTGRALRAPQPREPRDNSVDPDWRVGETWRVRITTAAGWRDDRIVRFTGDARHPAAVVRRRLSRGDGGQGRCDAVLAAIG
jgi:hypothetical protein